jgi:hypothetical protein
MLKGSVFSGRSTFVPQVNPQGYIARVVDKLGEIKADLAILKGVEEDCKVSLINEAHAPSEAFEGNLFRAVVSFGSKRVVDYKAILDELVEGRYIDQVSLQRIMSKHIEVAEGVPSVRVSARKGA